MTLLRRMAANQVMHRAADRGVSDRRHRAATTSAADRAGAAEEEAGKRDAAENIFDRRSSYLYSGAGGEGSGEVGDNPGGSGTCAPIWTD